MKIASRYLIRALIAQTDHESRQIIANVTFKSLFIQLPTQTNITDDLFM